MMDLLKICCVTLIIMQYLQDLDGTNMVEIYFLDTSKKMKPHVIDIRVDEKFVENIESRYRNWKTTKYMAYKRNHLTYLYDLTDDNQTVFSKLTNKYKQIGGNRLVMHYQYSKMPIHLFPCTKDIDNVQEYTISESKINNRVSLIIRRDEYGSYVYIEYKHSSNVDIEKIAHLIENLLKE
jgi:hypothetical protein